MYLWMGFRGQCLNQGMYEMKLVRKMKKKNREQKSWDLCARQQKGPRYYNGIYIGMVVVVALRKKNPSLLCVFRLADISILLFNNAGKIPIFYVLYVGPDQRLVELCARLGKWISALPYTQNINWSIKIYYNAVNANYDDVLHTYVRCVKGFDPTASTPFHTIFFSPFIYTRATVRGHRKPLSAVASLHHPEAIQSGGPGGRHVPQVFHFSNNLALKNL